MLFECCEGYMGRAVHLTSVFLKLWLHPCICSTPLGIRDQLHPHKDTLIVTCSSRKSDVCLKEHYFSGELSWVL